MAAFFHRYLFLIFNGVLTLLFGFIEKKFNYYRVRLYEYIASAQPA